MPIILGYIETYPNPLVINTINMITKSYIFYCSRKNLRLNIYHLQTRIKTAHDTYKFNSIKYNQSDKFNRIWKPFETLF